MKTLALASLSLALVAFGSGCEGSDSGPSSRAEPGSDTIAMGDVGGEDLVVQEAVAVRVDGDGVHGIAVVLTDRPGACAALRGDSSLFSAHTLSMFVADDTPTDSDGIDAKSIRVDAPRASFADWSTSCDSSNGLASLAATSGTIELDSIDLTNGERTLGTFDLHFGDDVLVGKFAAVYCDASATSTDPLTEYAVCI